MRRLLHTTEMTVAPVVPAVAYRACHGRSQPADVTGPFLSWTVRRLKPFRYGTKKSHQRILRHMAPNVTRHADVPDGLVIFPNYLIGVYTAGRNSPHAIRSVTIRPLHQLQHDNEPTHSLSTICKYDTLTAMIVTLARAVGASINICFLSRRSRGEDHRNSRESVRRAHSALVTNLPMQKLSCANVFAKGRMANAALKFRRVPPIAGEDDRLRIADVAPVLATKKRQAAHLGERPGLARPRSGPWPPSAMLQRGPDAA